MLRMLLRPNETQTGRTSSVGGIDQSNRQRRSYSVKEPGYGPTRSTYRTQAIDAIALSPNRFGERITSPNRRTAGDRPELRLHFPGDIVLYYSR